jgi:hypothetical protein
MPPVIGMLGLAVVVLGCNPWTTRPDFGPVEGAMQVELALRVPAATTALAEALKADTFPLSKVEPRDGYLETSWFSSASGKPIAHRPVGRETVRVRAWIGPSKPEHSQLVVETIFRPIEDPSLPDRELDRQVDPSDPTAQRVQAVLQRLTTQYGDSAAAPQPARPDTTRRP